MPPRFVINARARPTASFVRDAIEVSSVRPESAQLVVTGKMPWTVQVAYTATDDAASTTSATVVPSAAAAAVNLPAPGRYRLVSVADAYCAGEVLEPSVLDAVLAPIPAVTWDLSNAPSAVCQGAAAVAVPMALTGRGPWHLAYRETVHRHRPPPPFSLAGRGAAAVRELTVGPWGVISDAASAGARGQAMDDDGNAAAAKVDTFNITISAASYTLRLTPLSAGHRRYELLTLSDHNHHSVPLHGLVYDLVVRRYGLRGCCETEPCGAPAGGGRWGAHAR